MDIFISLPMKYREAEEIKARQEQIRQYVQMLNPGEKVKLLNNYFPLDIASKNESLHKLGMALEMMSDADLVVFAPNWMAARGCKIEHEAATAYGLKILDLDD